MSRVLSYYADDFTGATDALEAVSMTGLRSILLLDLPNADSIARYREYDVVGLAGTSRAMAPAEMDVELPPAFAFLRQLGSRVVHYKFCSTLDSSPAIGSIGRALELGMDEFPSRFVPVVVGVPALGRYCAFGNLFATSGLDSPAYRLDRHPTMQHHPVTPMHESDIRLHLGEQTHKSIALFDLLALQASDARRRTILEGLVREGADAILFDTLHEEHLRVIGGFMWERAHDAPVLTFGSSGVEYALTEYLKQAGHVSGSLPTTSLEASDSLLVISGSCSPVTAKQISVAIAHGFASVPLEASALVDRTTASEAIRTATEAARHHLAGGRHTIVHSCLGPDDPRMIRTATRGGDTERAANLNEQIGEAFRSVLKDILADGSVRRVVIAGGDTCGRVARLLPIRALEIVAPVAPGAPLCRAHAPNTNLDGLEIVFKGGQTGTSAYFTSLASGRTDAYPG